ncbi:MAG: phosphate/phosphite/phosphonate ABC transporter substrate-binding protein, partial [Desulfobulbaceae bacterium]|nr:phosphate/phosphite/phosphonate ABC transporter substrate-binding protein [Desulfobulbaceae bacterium]
MIHRAPPAPRLPLLAVLAVLLTALLLPGTAAATGPEPLRIAILPCSEVTQTFNKFQPLAAYLAKALSRPVVILVPRSFGEFERAVQKGETEFAFQSPHTYLRLADHYDRQNLLKALTPRGTTSHHGVVVTRRDSGINRVADLRGKKLIFGHPFSTDK